MPLYLGSLVGASIRGSAMVPKFLFEVAQRSDARYFSPAFVSRCDELTRLYQNDPCGAL